METFSDRSKTETFLRILTFTFMIQHLLAILELVQRERMSSPKETQEVTDKDTGFAIYLTRFERQLIVRNNHIFYAGCNCAFSVPKGIGPEVGGSEVKCVEEAASTRWREKTCPVLIRHLLSEVKPATKRGGEGNVVMRLIGGEGVAEHEGTRDSLQAGRMGDHVKELAETVIALDIPDVTARRGDETQIGGHNVVSLAQAHLSGVIPTNGSGGPRSGPVKQETLPRLSQITSRNLPNRAHLLLVDRCFDINTANSVVGGQGENYARHRYIYQYRGGVKYSTQGTRKGCSKHSILAREEGLHDTYSWVTLRAQYNRQEKLQRYVEQMIY